MPSDWRSPDWQGSTVTKYVPLFERIAAYKLFPGPDVNNTVCDLRTLSGA